MRRCDRIKKIFPRFYYNELPDIDKAAAKEHLKICNGCSAYFQKNREMLELIDKTRYTAQPGYNYTEEVMSGLSDTTKGHVVVLKWNPARFILRPAFVTTMLILLIVGFT